MAEQKEITENAVGERDKEGEESRFIPGERREDLEASRRSGAERRQNPDPALSKDKQQRRDQDRRTQEERRNDTYDVVCKTSGSLNSIEDWLDDHCDGEWTLVLLNLGEDLSQKSIKVIFSLFSDKTQFIENYRGEE